MENVERSEKTSEKLSLFNLIYVKGVVDFSNWPGVYAQRTESYARDERFAGMAGLRWTGRW